MVEKVLKDDVSEDWFLEFVSNYYSKSTMVSIKVLKGQFQLLGINFDDIAEKVFEEESLESSKQKIETKLTDLYKMRNIIAHQSSRDHYDAEYYDITKEQVENYIIDIENIGKAIYEVALTHN